MQPWLISSDRFKSLGSHQMDENRNSPFTCDKIEDADVFACHPITAPLTQLCNYTWAFIRYTPCASPPYTAANVISDVFM